MVKEFKEFIAQGSAFELAVGIILGIAFGAVVTSLVDDVIMQLIGAIFGQPSFNAISIHWGKDKHFRLLPPGDSKIHLLTLATDKYAVLATTNGLFRYRTAPGRDNDERRSKESYFLALFHGGRDACRGHVHVGQEFWWKKILKPRLQKSGGGGGVGDSAVEE